MTQVAMGDVMDGATELIKKSISSVLKEVSRAMQTAGSSHTDIVDDAINNVEHFGVFQDLHDQKSQIKFFTQHFGLLMPQKVALPGKAFFLVQI